MDSRTVRGHFIAGLFAGLRVVWPILSALLGLKVDLMSMLPIESLP